LDVVRLFLLWKTLLLTFRPCFTRPGFARFAQWVTGHVLHSHDHTLTQAILAIDAPEQWQALEHFARHGAWNRDAIDEAAASLLDTDPGLYWFGFRLLAGDDTKVHRTSKDVWGVCTFHEYSARSPNRATTVRAHNWVATGALLRRHDAPACYAPLALRLYHRATQLPESAGAGSPPVPFRTKPELMVEMTRSWARLSPGEKHLLAVDGGYALKSVIVPLVKPPAGTPRVDVVTRLRHDAALYRLPEPRREGQRGRPRKYGTRRSPPGQGGRWPGPWREGEAFVYGRMRKVRYKELVCLWRALGSDILVKVVVAEVEGYKERFTLLTTATELSGLEVVEVFAARFRQEDGFRDMKQLMGWEEGRAWTREPIERTAQVVGLGVTLLRCLERCLGEAGAGGWWEAPPWYLRKTRPSVGDAQRLLQGHRAEFVRCLSEWLGELEQSGGV